MSHFWTFKFENKPYLTRVRNFNPLPIIFVSFHVISFNFDPFIQFLSLSDQPISAQEISNHFSLNPTTKRSNQLYYQLRNIQKSEIPEIYRCWLADESSW